MKKLAIIALLLSTSACVVGPPVENQRERRVEQSLENAHKRDRYYRDNYYYRDNRYPNDRYYYYNNYDRDYDDDYNDPMGNYDQNHDRYYRSSN